MHAIITSIVCNPQPASLGPTMDALLRAAASGEYGSDKDRLLTGRVGA